MLAFDANPLETSSSLEIRLFSLFDIPHGLVQGELCQNFHPEPCQTEIEIPLQSISSVSLQSTKDC